MLQWNAYYWLNSCIRPTWKYSEQYTVQIKCQRVKYISVRLSCFLIKPVNAKCWEWGLVYWAGIQITFMTEIILFPNVYTGRQKLQEAQHTSTFQVSWDVIMCGWQHWSHYANACHISWNKAALTHLNNLIVLPKNCSSYFSPWILTSPWSYFQSPAYTEILWITYIYHCSIFVFKYNRGLFHQAFLNSSILNLSHLGQHDFGTWSSAHFMCHLPRCSFIENL